MATTLEQCKSKYASLLENQWVDTVQTLTTMGDIKGNSVYDIFRRMYKMPDSDVKWDVIDWMCDNRRELAADFSIPFWQQDLNISTWMQRVKKDYAPVDEFTLYCLGRMYNKHVIVLTMQEPWSTLSQQFQMNVQEVYAKSDVRLIYLGPGKYAKIRSNCESTTPLSSPAENTQTIAGKHPATAPNKGKGKGKGRGKKSTKTTCHTKGRSQTTQAERQSCWYSSFGLFATSSKGL